MGKKAPSVNAKESLLKVPKPYPKKPFLDDFGLKIIDEIGLERIGDDLA